MIRTIEAKKFLTNYLEIANIPKKFKRDIVIGGKYENYVLGLISYRKITFFYFLFINQRKEKRIIVLNPTSPRRYSKELTPKNFTMSFKWIIKNYSFITDDFS